MTQIKIDTDNKGLQKYYNKYGINKHSINSPRVASLATMAKLAYIYNTEIKGRHFSNNQKQTIDPFDALIYKYNGRNSQLKNKTATPDKNVYINNIKKFGRRFNMEEIRTYNVY